MSASESPFAGPENREWAEAAEQGRLLVKHCEACARNHYYPRPFCPFCFSEQVEYLEASGAGEIYTFTVNRTSPEARITAFVTLREGPTILTEIVDAAPENVRIGAQVTLEFRPSAMRLPAPMFRLAAT